MVNVQVSMPLSCTLQLELSSCHCRSVDSRPGSEHLGVVQAERRRHLQEQAREKEALLQEVIANFKNMRGSLQSSYTRVKSERDTLRKRIISLEMEQNKTGKHQDIVKGVEETKEVKRKKRKNKKGNIKITNDTEHGKLTVTGAKGNDAIERMIGRMILEAHKNEYEFEGDPKTIEIKTNDDDSYTVSTKKKSDAFDMEDLLAIEEENKKRSEMDNAAMGILRNATGLPFG